jgi:hypothetical protein
MRDEGDLWSPKIHELTLSNLLLSLASLRLGNSPLLLLPSSPMKQR